MFDSLSREFLGHARLCRILERQDACFIESVIIVADRRGEGLGRELMLLVEAYARDRGFQTAYLTSMNKQAFYTRLGYTFCEAVTASSGCHVSLGGVVRPRVIPAPSTVVPPKNSRQLDSGNSPPPPPLPPVVQQTKRLDRDWMMKTIMTWSEILDVNGCIYIFQGKEGQWYIYGCLYTSTSDYIRVYQSYYYHL